jgi:hypothetical protein
MYVTVSVASMQCALNDDNTLSVGTLQTAVPGAAGLYEHITHGSMAMRRALRVDRNAGVIYPPADGWSKQEYFVSFCECARKWHMHARAVQPARHCGHCCMETNGGDGNMFTRYEQATKQFQQSIALVQKLMSSSAGVCACAHAHTIRMCRRQRTL